MVRTLYSEAEISSVWLYSFFLFLLVISLQSVIVHADVDIMDGMDAETDLFSICVNACCGFMDASCERGFSNIKEFVKMVLEN